MIFSTKYCGFVPFTVRASFTVRFAIFVYYSSVLLNTIRYRNVMAAAWDCHFQHKSSQSRVALQIQDRSQKSRPVSSLNQSQTQMTRPVATGLALQRPPGLRLATGRYCSVIINMNSCRNFVVTTAPQTLSFGHWLIQGQSLHIVSTEHEPVTGAWGRVPSQVQQQSPWSGGKAS